MAYNRNLSIRGNVICNTIQVRENTQIPNLNANFLQGMVYTEFQANNSILNSISALSNAQMGFVKLNNGVAVLDTASASVSSPLSQFATTTSAEFASVISDETGTGRVVFNDVPTILNPIITGSIATQNTSFNLLISPETVNFATSANTISIGASSGSTTVNNNLVVGGNLTVHGTTTAVDSTVISVKDPVISLGGDSVPVSNDAKDRGVEIFWHDGVAGKRAFFGLDNSTGYFTFIPSANNSSEVFSGAAGDIAASNFRGNLVGNASSADKLSSGKTISLTGDVSFTSPAFDGSSNVAAIATLSNSGVTAGTYNNSSTQLHSFAVDAKGRITGVGGPSTITPAFSSITGKPSTLAGYGISDAQGLDDDLTSIAALTGTGLLKRNGEGNWAIDTTAYLTNNKTIDLSGDATGNGTTSIVVTLSDTGVVANTYKSVTVDSKGRITSGSNPTTLDGYGITDAQPLDADLTAIAVINGASGLLKKLSANTWSLDTNSYLTQNQNITIFGDASGSGPASIQVTLANTGVVANTYKSVTVDSKGRVTTGSNPTTLAGYGITDAEPTISSGTLNQFYRGDKTWAVVTKGNVGLGNVENTALSTWNGTTNLTTAGSLTVDALLPSINGTTDIGTANNRFRTIYVNEAKLSANTLYIGDTAILGTSAQTINIHADPNQSIDIQTSGTGTTTIESAKGTTVTTTGMNADVFLNATGTGSNVRVGATNELQVTAAQANFNCPVTLSSGTVSGNFTISGNLTVNGTQSVINSTVVAVKDNIVVYNSGELGSGVTAGTSGIQIDRGDLVDFQLVFDESVDMFKMGAIGSLETIASQPWVSANYSANNHNHTLDSLSNITITGKASGDLIKWDGSSWVNFAPSYLTGNQSISVSGDATGNGTTSISLTLANSGVTAGSYGSANTIPVITVDAKGRLTSVSTSSVYIPSGSISLIGDISATGVTGSSITTTLSASGVSAGTYNNSNTAITPIVVDSKGRITSTGGLVTITPAFSSITNKPTTLTGYGITDAEHTITAGTSGQYYRGDKSWATLDNSAVGLGNVENTALSTWAGSSSITTAGDLTATSLTIGQSDIKNVVKTINTNNSTIDIESLSASVYGSVHYLIQVINSTERNLINLYVLHDGTTIYIQESGSVYKSSALGTFDAVLSSGNVVLQYSGYGDATTNNITIKAVRTAIKL